MIKPLNNNILVEVEKLSKITEGGLIQEEDQELERGKVKSIGDEVTKIKKGDTVLFRSYSLESITVGKKKFTFVKEDEVFAIDN